MILTITKTAATSTSPTTSTSGFTTFAFDTAVNIVVSFVKLL